MACHTFKSRFQECFDHNNKIIDFPRNPIISHLNSSSSARQFITHSDSKNNHTLLRKCNSLPTRNLEQKNAATVVVTAPISVTNSPRLLSSTAKTNACSLKRRNHIRRKKMYRQKSCSSNSLSSSSSLQPRSVTATTTASIVHAN